jgi:HlyD family secretion protein
MKKKVLLVLAVVAVVTASVTAFYRGSGSQDGPKLTTTTVTRGSVVQAVEATGTLEAVTTVDVGTQVSGTIKALYADYNSQVRKGQVIAQLEPSLFDTQVEQARATVQRLQAEVDAARVQVEDTRVKLKRAHELSAKQLIPATDLETAEANARQAEASLKAAQAQVVQGRASLRNNEVNLGHTTIKAPIDGIVISRSVDVGQTVAASMSAPTLFVLAQDLRQMQVNARVDESDIGRIERGQQVEFRVDAHPDDTFTGTVKQVRLEPVIEQNVVSYVTVIDVPNPELKLKPGMTANVTIEIARADDILRVPNAALRFRATTEVFTALGQQAPETRAAGGPGAARGAGVWVVHDGRLARVPVEPGINDGTTTAVPAGMLQEGAQVVTAIAAQPTASASQGSGSPLLPQRPTRTRTQARTR